MSSELYTEVMKFVETYDPNNPEDRRIRLLLLERLHGEIHRREREVYPEVVDLGGES